MNTWKLPVAELEIRKAYKGHWVVFVPLDIWGDVIKWCNEMCGNGGGHKSCRWRANWLDGRRIFFKHEEDVLLFTLRWL
jgi:hypothetical protein